MITPTPLTPTTATLAANSPEDSLDSARRAQLAQALARAPYSAPALQAFLHASVPLSAAMHVQVLEVTPVGVLLRAPFAPNSNQHNTVFGGSQATLGVLASWCLVHTQLLAAGVDCTLVAARNSIDYTAPLVGDFTAQSRFAEADDWARFLADFAARGKAKITVHATLQDARGTIGGNLRGEFAALPPQHQPASR